MAGRSQVGIKGVGDEYRSSIRLVANTCRCLSSGYSSPSSHHLEEVSMYPPRNPKIAINPPRMPPPGPDEYIDKAVGFDSAVHIAGGITLLIILGVLALKFLGIIQ